MMARGDAEALSWAWLEMAGSSMGSIRVNAVFARRVVRRRDGSEQGTL